MKPTGHSYIALDIGTNSTLLLIARATPDGTLVEAREFFRTTRLGKGVDATGRLSADAIRLTLNTVREFVEEARRHAPRPALGVAATTSAARDAANRNDFLLPCREILGYEPRILDGDEEAETVFRGAASDRPPDRFVVNADIGGGSTEIAAGRPGQCLYRTSLNIGCVRFGERFDLFEIADSANLAAARREVRERLCPVAEAVRRAANGAAIDVLASGGTATTLAALAQALRVYDRSRVHGYGGGADEVAHWIERLWRMPSAERAELPGMEGGRAAVFPTGLLILSEYLAGLGALQFTVTTRGLRFGLACRLAAGDLPPQWAWT